MFDPAVVTMVAQYEYHRQHEYDIVTIPVYVLTLVYCDLWCFVWVTAGHNRLIDFGWLSCWIGATRPETTKEMQVCKDAWISCSFYFEGFVAIKGFPPHTQWRTHRSCSVFLFFLTGQFLWELNVGDKCETVVLMAVVCLCVGFLKEMSCELL